MPNEERLFPINKELVREQTPALGTPVAQESAPREQPLPSSRNSSVCDLRQPDEPMPRPAAVPVLATQVQVTKVKTRLEDAKGVFIRVLGVTCEGMKPHKRYPVTLKWGDTGETKTITLPSVDEKNNMTETEFLQSSHAALKMQHKRRLQAKIQTVPGCCSSPKLIGLTRVDMRPFVMDIENCHRPTLFECTLVNAKEVECGSLCLEMNLVFTEEHAGAQHFAEEEAEAPKA